MVERVEHGAVAAEPELEPVCSLRGVPRRADPVARLEGGDLGEVQHVPYEHPVAGELDGRVVVDREVPERVRSSSARHRKRHRGDDESDNDRCSAPHSSAPRATGAHRTENAGLCSSALRYHARIARPSPAQPAAYPRWK